MPRRSPCAGEKAASEGVVGRCVDFAALRRDDFLRGSVRVARAGGLLRTITSACAHERARRAATAA